MGQQVHKVGLDLRGETAVQFGLDPALGRQQRPARQDVLVQVIERLGGEGIGHLVDQQQVDNGRYRLVQVHVADIVGLGQHVADITVTVLPLGVSDDPHGTFIQIHQLLDGRSQLVFQAGGGLDHGNHLPLVLVEQGQAHPHVLDLHAVVFNGLELHGRDTVALGVRLQLRIILRTKEFKAELAAGVGLEFLQ